MHTFLTIVGLLATIGVLVLLLRAAVRRSPRAGLLVALAVLLGLVFVNPLKVVAHRVAADPRPLAPSTVSNRSAHWLKVDGVPIAWFSPYQQNYLYVGDSGEPSAQVNLRYGFSFLVSAGNSTTDITCQDDCGLSKYPLVHYAGSRPWLEELGPASSAYDLQPKSAALVPTFYRVSLGWSSGTGLIVLGLYWLLLAALVALASTRLEARRLLWAPLAGAAAAIVLGVLQSLLAAATAEAQGPVQMPPTVTPKTPAAVQQVQTRQLSDVPIAPGCRTMTESARTCNNASVFAALEQSGRIRVVWLENPEQEALHLYTRQLSLAGRPLGPSVEILDQLPQCLSSAQAQKPLRMQITRLSSQRLLLAWITGSGYCEPNGDGAQATIYGLLLDGSARAIGHPFVIVRPQLNSDLKGRLYDFTGGSFWLSSTVQGQPLLAWLDAKGGPAQLHASFLGANGKLANPEVVPLPLPSGSQLAVSCGQSCLVASLDQDRLRLTSLRPGHKPLVSGLPVPETTYHSRPALLAHGSGFLIGWLDSSDLTAVTARLARWAPGRPGAVRALWQRVPAGGLADRVPQPYGLSLAFGSRPTLVWPGAQSGGQHGTNIYLADGQGNRILSTSHFFDVGLSAEDYGTVPGPHASSVIGLKSFVSLGKRFAPLVVSLGQDR